MDVQFKKVKTDQIQPQANNPDDLFKSLKIADYKFIFDPKIERKTCPKCK